MVQPAVRPEPERGAMAAERLSMRQIREILRQKWTLGRSHREVAQPLGAGLGTVSGVERRARAAGLDWPQVEAVSDAGLEARLYGPPTPPTHHRPVPYAAATRTQQVPDWLASHQRAFQFFGGVTTAIVCDQLKSGVTLPCRYEPGLQRTYEEFAQHYGTVILPARPAHPRDKPKI